MTRLCTHAGIEDLHVHDMRKALATWAGDNGILPHVVDYILHHAAKTTTGAHYDFSTMDPLVRPALQAWADHVEAVADGRRLDGNVTPLQAATGCIEDLTSLPAGHAAAMPRAGQQAA